MYDLTSFQAIGVGVQEIQHNEEVETSSRRYWIVE